MSLQKFRMDTLLDKQENLAEVVEVIDKEVEKEDRKDLERSTKFIKKKSRKQ